ncbi:hypothetical protein DZF91_07715 [Actinomadura logoneensis]|uniref:CU044_5270 family protein n=1 Tax=Actinomadura logoneensis TaxID=2293572 RepID=A0A372JQD4_9ACTN|nr:hypothetical protein DZF91_07715 [Actinomadura logoneensis]
MRGAALTAVAVAAASAVAVALVGTSSDERGARASGPSAEETRVQSLAARRFLLAAADSLDKDTKPLPTGRWWRQRVVEGQAFHVGRGRGYTVDMEVEKDSWQSRTEHERPTEYVDENGRTVTPPPRLRHLSFARTRPVVPQTPADEAAWRTAGAPVRWQTTADGDKVNLTRDNTRPPQYEGSPYVQTPDRDATGHDAVPDVNERLRVGRDPAAFVAAMRAAPGFLEDSAQRLRAGSRFLGDKLATPRARAAAFRALAALPGVRSVGTVKDARGRSGIALAPPWIDRVDGTVVEYQLILDPRTYDILGDQMLVKRSGRNGVPAGALFSYGYVLEEGWTNTTPPSH